MFPEWPFPPRFDEALIRLKSSKVKIAFMIPNLLGGGAERVVSELLQNLSESFEKYLILFEKRLAYPVKENVTVIDLNIPASRNPLKKIVNLILRASKIPKIRKEKCLDVVLSFLGSANFPNLLSCSPNASTIVSVRSTLSKKQSTYSKFSNLVVKKLYKRADKIIAVSYGVKRDLIGNFKIDSEKIEVIQNPCDVRKIQPLSKEPLGQYGNLMVGKPTIVNMGGLRKPKGQWHLLRAFKKAKREVGGLTLLILGTGVLEDYLKKLAQATGYSKDIHFLGFQENPFKFMAKANAFVLPSLWEGFPNALVEAMACGTPVIATDCDSGPREVLAPNTSPTIKTNSVENAQYGLLVPPMDGKFYPFNAPLTKEENFLAKAIIELIVNKDLNKKYSSLALERAKDFETEKITDKYTQLFYDLVSRR